MCKVTGESTLLALAGLLAQVGARWAVIDAHAANHYRSAARMTQDIDILVSALVDRVALTRAIDAHGWVVRQATPDGDLLRLRHPDHGPVDVLFAGTEYQEGALARAPSEPVAGGQPVPLLAIEDVLLHKLIAGRFQDLADVEAILATRPRLDRGYLMPWIAYWDLRDAWTRIAGNEA